MRALFVGFVAFVVASLATADICPPVVAAQGGRPLKRRERLTIALARLAAMTPAPATGEEAYQRMAEVFRAVEKEFFPAAMVDEAFRVYDYANAASTYEEKDHPPEYAEILKPPARRYGWKQAGADREILFQLDHITIFHKNGATEIQRIDPIVRAWLKDPKAPLVVAVHHNATYMQWLPHREDLVLFRKAGRDGRGVW